MQAARGASLTSDQMDPDPIDAVPSDAEASDSRPRHPRLALFAGVALVAYLLDQGSKQWAVSTLTAGDIPVLGDWFVLHLTFNPGAAFSTGTRFTIVFTCLAIIAVCVVLWLCRRVGSTAWAWALGLLLAGVGGNLTDRIFRDPEPLRGHVVDFLMLPNWPVFNLADICINLAAGLIIVQTMRGVTIDGKRVDHE